MTGSSVTLSWTASTDNVNVSGYEVLDGTTVVGTTATTSLQVTGLTPDTSYTFSVRAKDASGNVSPASAPITVRTTHRRRRAR